MKENDIAGLLDAYEKQYPDYLTIERYLDAYTYWHYEPAKDLDDLISSICYNMEHCSAGRLGIYQAFQTGDMATLNDALYQYACEKHLNNGSDGTDHSSCCRHGGALYHMMAANLWERVPLLMPKALGTAKNGMVVTANLFLALWYKDPAVIEQARERAIKALNRKSTLYHRASDSYLLALLDGKIDDASQYLKDVCNGAKRLSKDYTDDFEKAFCIEAHGLYNLAIHLGVDGVEMPETTNFSKEFATWQIENGSKHGKLFLEYPAPLELVNTVFAITPPEVRLHRPHPEDRYSLPERDTVTFRCEVRDAALRRLGLNPDDWFTHQMPEGYNYTKEELAYINKYHCNRWSHIRLHKDDFDGQLPRRFFKFGTSGLAAAETIDPESSKYIWAVVSRKKMHHGPATYHSLYYSAYYDSLEALVQGSTAVYRELKKIAASMEGFQYTEKGNSYCFETGIMNVDESIHGASTNYLNHRQFFGARRFSGNFPERIKVTEIFSVTQALERLCKEWHMDIPTILRILELIDNNSKLYKFCEDNEMMFEGSRSEIFRVLDNGTERVMLDFYVVDPTRAHLKSAQTVSDTMF